MEVLHPEYFFPSAQAEIFVSAGLTRLAFPISKEISFVCIIGFFSGFFGNLRVAHQIYIPFGEKVIVLPKV